MKGIILAGGMGTRLGILTKLTNKHLLPLFDRPLIYYPIQTLVNAGIKEIMIVTGGNSSGDFLRLLENGEEWNLKSLQYAYQRGSGGIADALSLTKNFVGSDNMVVILGDNLFFDNIQLQVDKFSYVKYGSHIFLKQVLDPNRFGVVEFNEKYKIINIEEKPKEPKSNYAVVGLYMYTPHVFDVISTLKPSGRNELEITDVNNYYVKNNAIEYSMIQEEWIDCGTPSSLLKASNLVASRRSNE